MFGCRVTPYLIKASAKAPPRPLYTRRACGPAGPTRRDTPGIASAWPMNLRSNPTSHAWMSPAAFGRDHRARDRCLLCSASVRSRCSRCFQAFSPYPSWWHGGQETARPGCPPGSADASRDDAATTPRPALDRLDDPGDQHPYWNGPRQDSPAALTWHLVGRVRGSLRHSKALNAAGSGLLGGAFHG